MRNALILLAVVALVFVAAGAINHSLTFDIEYGIGEVRNVSLFWITVVTAGVLFVTGLVAAWLARSAAVADQRRLESELQQTYERLRASEARALMAAASEPERFVPPSFMPPPDLPPAPPPSDEPDTHVLPAQGSDAGTPLAVDDAIARDDAAVRPRDDDDTVRITRTGEEATRIDPHEATTALPDDASRAERDDESHAAPGSDDAEPEAESPRR